MADLASTVRFLKDTFTTVSLNDLTEIVKASKIRKYEAGTLLLHQGEKETDVRILMSGLVRLYTMQSDGEEKTLAYMERGDHVASVQTVLRGEAGLFYAEVMEPIQCLQFDSKVMDELEKRNPRLQQFKVRGMERALDKMIDLVQFHILYKPEERFKVFAERHPKLLDRVSQKNLASMLGMTPVSLSRIKNRLKEEEND
ncbi:Crp/Fnr family transcriptional regulator [Cryomorphaceae bacterium]|nr:Crp/Fnr family transcriptional regulator [Cryomorphaceae bacterium]